MKPWLEIALGEVGVKETPGAGSTSRIDDYLRSVELVGKVGDEIAWCSAFVNWVMICAGYEGTDRANAQSWLKWGRPILKPERGCIVVLKRGTLSWQGHVGFWMGEHNGHLDVLGGNQDNMVCQKIYSKEDVLGYRMPLARKS